MSQTPHTYTTPIAEGNDFIVLDKYEKHVPLNDEYQTESELERTFIEDLVRQGYGNPKGIRSPEALEAHVQKCLEELNGIQFTSDEWARFKLEYLDNPSDGVTDKSHKLHENHIYDFTFDDGHVGNVMLLDKQHLARNKVEVINQFTQSGWYKNRYDVTILVNGLPLVQVELKRRGVTIRQAFNQVERYKGESLFTEDSLFRFVQIFVISNGTDTRYFANTTTRDKNHYEFTMNWARSDNTLIRDLKDFTATFFQKNTLLQILTQYCVFDSNNTLLIMRPYQIAAAERIIWKIRGAFLRKELGKIDAGGYIWHTTGSGKTLTSFKAARLATELEFVDKVIFVVDRKDLDYQTVKEYQRFSPDSVNSTSDTAGLKRTLAKADNKIVVTTIQKLNRLVSSSEELRVYQQNVVFIFDECHRSQFGEAQRNIRRRFRKYFQFGFTGTPIFVENAQNIHQTTEGVFGQKLHTYVITDAIRDGKVLKFKVDYNNVRPTFTQVEKEQDLETLAKPNIRKLLMHRDRIREVTQYILDNYHIKTARQKGDENGFNAMLAVSCVDAAKMYYQAFKDMQKDAVRPIRVATIFSYAANEESRPIGEIEDEEFEEINDPKHKTAKQFLQSAIDDYNAQFKTNFDVSGQEFQNYYNDLARRVRRREVDLLIVVGMFLTGFDAPRLNTLFVDKDLRYHGLIQAYSRTNRILDARKTFGNIVTFRDLEQPTIRALELFCDTQSPTLVIERSFEEYLHGFKDESGSEQRGYLSIVKELQEKFLDIDRIERESDKKAFVELFGAYLKVENALKNYDEFTALVALQRVDQNDPVAMQDYKNRHHLDDDQVKKLSGIPVLKERVLQDYLSTYNDILEEVRSRSSGGGEAAGGGDEPVIWDGVEFQVDLLKTQEITLDYILDLLAQKDLHKMSREELIAEVNALFGSSLETRGKKELMMEFIDDEGVKNLRKGSDLTEQVYKYARRRLKEEAQQLIEEESLEPQKARRFIDKSRRSGKVNDQGMELFNMMPKMSPLNPDTAGILERVLGKLKKLVDKYKGIGGKS